LVNNVVGGKKKHARWVCFHLVNVVGEKKKKRWGWEGRGGVREKGEDARMHFSMALMGREKKDQTKYQQKNCWVAHSSGDTPHGFHMGAHVDQSPLIACHPTWNCFWGPHFGWQLGDKYM